MVNINLPAKLSEELFLTFAGKGVRSLFDNFNKTDLIYAGLLFAITFGILIMWWRSRRRSAPSELEAFRAKRGKTLEAIEEARALQETRGQIAFEELEKEIKLKKGETAPGGVAGAGG
jgi:hypothetical protein